MIKPEHPTPSGSGHTVRNVLLILIALVKLGLVAWGTLHVTHTDRPVVVQGGVFTGPGGQPQFPAPPTLESLIEDAAGRIGDPLQGVQRCGNVPSGDDHDLLTAHARCVTRADYPLREALSMLNTALNEVQLRKGETPLCVAQARKAARRVSAFGQTWLQVIKAAEGVSNPWDEASLVESAYPEYVRALRSLERATEVVKQAATPHDWPPGCFTTV